MILLLVIHNHGVLGFISLVLSADEATEPVHQAGPDDQQQQQQLLGRLLAQLMEGGSICKPCGRTAVEDFSCASPPSHHNSSSTALFSWRYLSFSSSSPPLLWKRLNVTVGCLVLDRWGRSRRFSLPPRFPQPPRCLFVKGSLFLLQPSDLIL